MQFADQILGINGYVVRIGKHDGKQVWRTRLKGGLGCIDGRTEWHIRLRGCLVVGARSGYTGDPLDGRVAGSRLRCRHHWLGESNGCRDGGERGEERGGE